MLLPLLNHYEACSYQDLYDYRAPYSEYTILREEHRSQQIAAYKNQQKIIADTNRFIERFRYKSTKAAQVQSRIKGLEKMDRIKIDGEDTSSIRIRFPAAPRSGNLIFNTKGLSKSYGGENVLDSIDFIISRGERIAFIGKNGEGKTTLSRILVNDLDFKGSLKVGHNVKIGYFAQNQDELLNEKLSVMETISRAASGEAGTRLRSLPGAFLFRDGDIDKKVKVLYGGERSRQALIKLLLESSNVLVLDEPTNHLDMQSKDILKKALQNFSGTLIIVSHDREFLDGLIDNVYEFRDHKISKYIGNIYDFLEKKKIDSLRHLESRKGETVGKTREEQISPGKDNYLEKKAFQRTLRKITKEITGCESSIEHLENEIKELTDQFKSPENLAGDQNNSSLFLKYEKQRDELDSEMKKWEQLLKQFAELKKSKYYSIS